MEESDWDSKGDGKETLFSPSALALLALASGMMILKKGLVASLVGEKKKESDTGHFHLEHEAALSVVPMA